MSKDQKRTPSHSTIAALDGVRAIACLLVVSYHLHYIISKSYSLSAIAGPFGFSLAMSGWSGVTLFFLLSGFLLFLPYARSLLFAQSWPPMRRFYLRRMLRILPGYYVSLLLLILLSHPEYLRADHLPALSLFLTLLMDAPATYQNINGPFWTLAVEWQFYMLLPLIAWGFSWLVRHGKTPLQRLRLLGGCLASMALWGLGTRYAGHYFSLHPEQTWLVSQAVRDKILLVIYGSSGKYFEDFALGMFISSLFIFTQQAAQEHALSIIIKRYGSWLWVTGILLLIGISSWQIFDHGQLGFLYFPLGAHGWLNEGGYALGFGSCMLAILFNAPGLKMLFEWRLLRWLGNLSYSLYIWHIPIFTLFRDQFISRLPHKFILIYPLYWLCVLLLIVPFAYLFHRYIEQPWIRIGQGNTRSNSLSQAYTTPK